MLGVSHVKLDVGAQGFKLVSGKLYPPKGKILIQKPIVIIIGYQWREQTSQ
jgi:hypothetical protein